MWSKIKEALPAIGVALAVSVVGVSAFFGGRATITTTVEDGKINYTVEAGGSLELPQATVFETADGEIVVENAPVVEAVDSNNSSKLTECSDSETECGLGAYFYAPTDTPYAFYEYTKGGCWNTDGAYGAQCWDYGDLFWQNYAGHRLSTCGTGAAKGTIADGCWQINAGDDFVMEWDPHNLQPGDFAVFTSGTWGHIGEVLGYYDNGYILLAGQNQGGASCDGGGSAVNVIKISLRDFAGAFRPKAYIKPEPTPEPTPEPANCDVIDVVEGDTMGKIMERCEGKVEWGEAMNEYARSWKSTKYLLYPNVYAGWQSENGYGLFAGDTIVRVDK